MIKYLLIFSAVSILQLCLQAKEFYANRALNPVKFEKPAEHADIPLVKNGKLNFVIVCDLAVENKKMHREWKSVTLAVQALQDAFIRTTGKKPQAVSPDSPEAKKAQFIIALGKSSVSDKLKLDLAALPKEGFTVRSFDKGVIIAGHDGSAIPGSYNHMDWARYRINGTLNGTYDFIERVLGIRYYYPGAGIVAPKIRNLLLKPVAYTDGPKYRNRFNWGYNHRMASFWKHWKGFAKINRFDNAWRLAMSTRWVEACHSPDPHFLLAAFPDKKETIFFRDRTGYMYYNPATHIGNLMDITNPELAKLLVDSYKKFYDTDGKWRAPWRNKAGKSWYPPNSEYVIFGQADTFVRDLMSEKNKHLFPESRRNSASGKLSDLYVNFYSWIGKELKKQLPGKRLSVLAYHNYTLPPLVCKDIPDNIDFQVCMGRIVMAKAEASQKMWKETFSTWYKVLGNRGVSAWTYGSQGNAFTQAIQGRYMKNFLACVGPWLADDGLFMDASGLRWEFYYSYYPVYRLFWNPGFDVDAALNEHWEKLYGKKAGKILQNFYALLVERWEKAAMSGINRAGDSANTNVTPAVLYSAYNLPTVAKLEKMLKAALAATAPGSIERRRVEFFAQPWQKDFIAARAYCTMSIPTYQVKQLATNEKITIDGKLTEGIWKRVQVMPMQQAKGQGGPLPSEPQPRLVWDKNGIYLGFTCSGSPRINKGDVWFDSDNIEFFLSPGVEKATYYQFALSPGNDFVDSYKVEKPMEAALDSKWECPGLKRAVSVEKDRWSCEIFIPFAGLHRTAPPRPYTSWFGNFVNNKLSGLKQNSEYSSFSMTMGKNHNHSLWGKFKFMGKGD